MKEEFTLLHTILEVSVKNWSTRALDRNYLKLNVEELIGCSKLYSTVFATKAQGRAFKRETNWVLLSIEGKLISSTALYWTKTLSFIEIFEDKLIRSTDFSEK